MLLIALPNKGSLAEQATALLGEAGYRCRRNDKDLWALDPENQVEFVFLRPRDIAVYVSRGVIEAGVTGQDLVRESGVDVAELMPLGFGRSCFRYAAPRGCALDLDHLAGQRIATSYPNIVREDMRRRAGRAEVVELDGAVEISVRLGVADLIADVVQTGRTLEQAGLAVVGEPIMNSEAVLIARDRTTVERPDLALLQKRLRGVVVARDYIMVEYDVPTAALEEACRITPGIESPTVSPLNEKGWTAVKAMARRRHANRIMDALAELGAKGIIVTDIRTCRI